MVMKQPNSLYFTRKAQFSNFNQENDFAIDQSISDQKNKYDLEIDYDTQKRAFDIKFAQLNVA